MKSKATKKKKNLKFLPTRCVTISLHTQLLQIMYLSIQLDRHMDGATIECKANNTLVSKPTVRSLVLDMFCKSLDDTVW